MRERVEHTLAFRTRYRLFEPTITQFGTTNAPADFPGYIINSMREALDEFASAYLDDVLIYNDSVKEHEDHVEWIMHQLLDAGFYLKPEKCEFHKDTVKYLRLIISTREISMDEE